MTEKNLIKRYIYNIEKIKIANTKEKIKIEQYSSNQRRGYKKDG